MNKESQTHIGPPTRPLFIVLSGLSGAGKDAVLNVLKQSGSPLEFIVTVTTRAKRPSERDKIDYHFVTGEDFQKLMDNGELLEWAKVYDNWYGVPKKQIREALARGKDAIVRVDVQGVANIKKILPQAVFIFLTPPSIEDCNARLIQRSTESAAELKLRLDTAREELKQLPLFDYLVINPPGQIERAVAEIKAIIAAEKCRVKARELSL